MKKPNIKRTSYRIPTSKYWEQYWYPWPVAILATCQLIMTFITVSMEIGNVIVDLFRANIFSGFWSFPFMILTVIATYACVCTNKTQTKAIVALVFQIISIFIMIIVIGFLIAFIASNYTLCLGYQCTLSSSTTFSSTDYLTLKRAFISCELVGSILYIILAILYIILYIKCYKKIPRVHPIIRSLPNQNRQLSNSSRLSQPRSMSTMSYNRSDVNEQLRIPSSSSLSYSSAQKVCPNCKHVSPYIPQTNIVECPNCGYQSPLVEHAQQW